MEISDEQGFVIKGNIRRQFRDAAQCPLNWGPLNRGSESLIQVLRELTETELKAFINDDQQPSDYSVTRRLYHKRNTVNPIYNGQLGERRKLPLEVRLYRVYGDGQAQYPAEPWESRWGLSLGDDMVSGTVTCTTASPPYEKTRRPCGRGCEFIASPRLVACCKFSLYAHDKFSKSPQVRIWILPVKPPLDLL